MSTRGGAPGVCLRFGNIIIRRILIYVFNIHKPIRAYYGTYMYIHNDIMMCINKSSVAMYIHVHVGDVQQRSMQRLT